MLLGEKSLSDLLRIAFPYTFSEPPTVSASLPRAVKLWGWSREQRSLQGAVGHCWAPFLSLERAQAAGRAGGRGGGSAPLPVVWG